MARYVALLRGINVGRHKRMPMADLRDLLSGLGYSDVKTLLQSGNAVFTSPVRSAAGVEKAIEKAIVGRFQFDVRVLVRTKEEVEAAVAANPLPVPDGSRFLVSFLDKTPPTTRLEQINAAEVEPERFAVGTKVLYIWCARGFMDSKLLPQLSDERLGVVATARNWNTVTKLVAMASR